MLIANLPKASITQNKTLSSVSSDNVIKILRKTLDICLKQEDIIGELRELFSASAIASANPFYLLEIKQVVACLRPPETTMHKEILVVVQRR